MSDELLLHDQMIYDDRETPWHRKGIPWNEEESGVLTPARALELAAPWTVEKRPLYVAGSTGDELIRVPDRFAVVRMDIDLPLGIVSEQYEEFQHAEGFEIVEVMLAEAGGAKVETAGTLRDGRIVWLLCHLDREVVIGGDRHEPYLLFWTSHDGTYAVSIGPVTIRVVCKNTLDMAIGGMRRAWRAVHSKNIEKSAAQARQALDFGYRYYDAFEAEVAELQATTVTHAQFDGIVETMFPPPVESTKRSEKFTQERRDAVHALYDGDRRVGQFRGTGWGVVQAFSTYELWIKRVRGDRAERQMLGSIRGIGGRLSERARELVRV